MRKRPSHGKLIMAILTKDFRLYTRNMVYLFLTVLSLVFFAAIFWLVPDSVEEELSLAVSPTLDMMVDEAREILQARGVPGEMLGDLDLVREELAAEEGLVLIGLESEEELQELVRGELTAYRTDTGEIIVINDGEEETPPEGAEKLQPQAGIAFASSFFADVALGDVPRVTLYADARIPAELQRALEALVRELANELAGREMPVEFPADDAVILGTDRLGEQISMRQRMRPMIAFFILMMETFALASLISNEVLQRTVTALLVTPVRVGHFLLAKTIFGTALAMSQAVVVLALVGAFTGENWFLLLLVSFLGSLLFTAVAMFVGSAGKDFIGQLMFSMLFIIPLMIPSFAVLFPGTVASWVSYLPSYPVVRLLYDITVYGAGWNEALGPMLYAAAWSVFIYGAGLVVLKRKVSVL